MRMYLQMRYPNNCSEMLADIDKAQNSQQQGDKQLIGSLAQLVQHLVTDEQGKLKPEFDGMQQQLQSVAQRVQQTLNPTQTNGSETSNNSVAAGANGQGGPAGQAAINQQFSK